MKVVIAIDSLKGSLSSLEAGTAAAAGIHHVDPAVETVVRPLADGGEGTVQALTEGLGGRFVTVPVTGPAGKPVDCPYGILDQTQTAIIEMSGAAGITQVHGEEKNPLYTTTYGVGEVICDAIRNGCRRFIIGIGGSATNDGGIGMLQALGFGLLDADGKQVPFGAVGLESLAAITTDHVLPELSECTFRIACDVTNPLCGFQGATYIYGPQKGVTSEMLPVLDAGMENYARITADVIGRDNMNASGAGAAGGLGFAFLSYLNGELTPGIQLILNAVHLEDEMKNADVVVTGEGRLDHQTAMGKAPVGVAKLGKKYGAKTVAFAGSVTKEAVACNEAGIDAFFPIVRGISTLEEAMDPDTAKANMTASAEQVFRLF